MNKKIISCPRCGTQEGIEISRKMETWFSYRVEDGEIYELGSPIPTPVGEYYLYCSECGQEDLDDGAQWKASYRQKTIIRSNG